MPNVVVVAYQDPVTGVITNIEPPILISASSLPLPTGASTEGKQDAQIVVEQAIFNKLIASPSTEGKQDSHIVVSQALLDELKLKADLTEQQPVNVYGKTGDATYQVPRLDPSTHSIQVIDYAHHEIHGGSHFSYTNAIEFSNGQVVSFVVVTPDTLKYAHFGFTVEGKGEFSVDTYESASPASNGSLVSNPAVINDNRNISDVHTTLIYSSPTLGAGSKGTLIKKSHVGVGKSSGGEAGTTHEIILKRNTKYWFDLTNQTTSANWISWIVAWYEHTDKSV